MESGTPCVIHGLGEMPYYVPMTTTTKQESGHTAARRSYVVLDDLRNEWLAFPTERLLTSDKSHAHRFSKKADASRQARLLALELGRSNLKTVMVLRAS